jgi:hypothetical protein
MSTAGNPIEQGIFSKLSAHVAVVFAKIKKRRKDLAEKESSMAAQIKLLIENDKFTNVKKTKDGANGTIETHSYQPPDSPFALVMTRYLKKDAVDYKAECLRLYKKMYGEGKWKKPWAAFTKNVDLNPIESLDVDVNPGYIHPRS